MNCIVWIVLLKVEFLLPVSQYGWIPQKVFSCWVFFVLLHDCTPTLWTSVCYSPSQKKKTCLSYLMQKQKTSSVPLKVHLSLPSRRKRECIESFKKSWRKCEGKKKKRNLADVYNFTPPWIRTPHVWTLSLCYADLHTECASHIKCVRLWKMD